MKKFLFFLFCIECVISCSTSEKITKCTMKFDGKGEITLKRTEGDIGVRFKIETYDPVALRTLMMQGLSLQIIGTNSDTTTIIFPSARDVSSQIEHHPGEVKATLDGDKEKRPDIRPLVTALRKADVRISKTGLRTISVEDNHDVSINPANGILSYSVEVPYDYMCEGYNVVTLKSVPGKNMNVSSEYTSKRQMSPNKPNLVQPFGVNNQSEDGGLQKKIILDFLLNKIENER